MKYTHHNVLAQVSNDKVQSYVDFLRERHTHLSSEISEDSINLPAHGRIIEEVLSLSAEMSTPTTKYICIIGIGGSNLGAKAVYDAIAGQGDDSLYTRTRKAVWPDTMNPQTLKDMLGYIEGSVDKNEFIIIVISKSGGTTETIANASVVLDAMEHKWGDVSDRTVAITDAESSLSLWADAHHVHALHIPAYVGGRFSVFSAAGLFPLVCLGVDIVQLLEGASKATDGISLEAFSAQSAQALHTAYLDGITIHTMFVFGPAFETLGKWYAQLIGESLGKERTIHNAAKVTGITPLVSVGSIDLHSVGQLYLGGPRDKITTFVYYGGGLSYTIPDHSIAHTSAYITGKQTKDIMSAIYEGTVGAYGKKQLPYSTVELDADIVSEVGFLMQSYMIQIMILGYLLEVNAFNQPNVEEYKIITKQKLR